MVSAEDYEQIEAMKLDVLRAKIQRGLADVEEGRVTGSDEVFAELDRMIDRDTASSTVTRVEFADEARADIRSITAYIIVVALIHKNQDPEWRLQP